MENVKVPIWQKTWFVVLACIFVPPAGISLLWVGKKGGMALRIILTVILGFYSLAWLSGVFGGTSSNPTQTNTTEINESFSDPETIDEVGVFYNATIGDYSTSYSVPTGGGFTTMSIKKYDNLTIGSNNFNNCIDLQVYSTVDTMSRFTSEEAYFQVLDSNGDPLSDINVFVGENGDNISVIIECSDSIENTKYLIIGGTDPGEIGKTSKLIYTVS